MSTNKNDNESIRNDVQTLVEELKSQGIKHNSKEHEIVGLGDIIEQTLNKLGITQERFKQLFGLKECNCTERKEFLNNVLSWKIRKGK